MVDKSGTKICMDIYNKPIDSKQEQKYPNSLK